MRRSMLAAAAAISMISLSSGAVAQSAAALSLQPLSPQANVRAGADLQDASNIRGGFILPTLGILAIVALVYFLTKGGDNAASP